MAKSLSLLPESLAPNPSAEPDRQVPWQERRTWFQSWLQQHPLPGVGEEEVQMHLAGMPAHYWECVGRSELAWGLQTVHGFLTLIATPETVATAPFVDSKADPKSNGALMMLCTWDRQGLLAKCAACFSAVKLTVLQGNVFTRADNLVLDVFRVSDVGNPSTANPARLQEMAFLLEGALSEPPRFAAMWACSRHKLFAPAPRIPHRISFSDDPGAEATVVTVEASDRLGLLYDILQAIAESALSITQARIETQDGVARDTLHVADARGQRRLKPEQLEELRRCLDAALTVRH